MKYYRKAMGRYVDFQGRSSRSEFWIYTASVTLIVFIAAILDNIAFGSGNDKAIFLPIVYLVHLLPGLSVFVRRLHDTNRTGWWVLLAGFLIPYVFACFKGNSGPNRFGPEPIESVSNVIPEIAGEIKLNHRDLIGELERLAKLRQEGHLSDVEYEVMKSKALSG